MPSFFLYGIDIVAEGDPVTIPLYFRSLSSSNERGWKAAAARGHNPFVFQVSFFLNPHPWRVAYTQCLSQSLCISGLFLPRPPSGRRATRRCHNPFVFQVSFFLGNLITGSEAILSVTIPLYFRSLSSCRKVAIFRHEGFGHNPFVFQVSFFPYATDVIIASALTSQSLCISGLFLPPGKKRQIPHNTLATIPLYFRSLSSPIVLTAIGLSALHNPFVFQVSFFPAYWQAVIGWSFLQTQSLCISGLFLPLQK